jgi:hypothetical protein
MVPVIFGTGVAGIANADFGAKGISGTALLAFKTIGVDHVCGITAIIARGDGGKDTGVCADDLGTDCHGAGDFRFVVEAVEMGIIQVEGGQAAKVITGGIG